MGAVGRGVELLVKKASVDAAFRRHLLAERSKAAGAIGLTLSAGEAAMIDAIPAEQLEAIIVRTKVEAKHRAVFLGYAGAAMVLALGAAPGCILVDMVSMGVRPETLHQVERERIETEQPPPVGERYETVDPEDTR